MLGSPKNTSLQMKVIFAEIIKETVCADLRNLLENNVVRNFSYISIL